MRIPLTLFVVTAYITFSSTPVVAHEAASATGGGLLAGFMHPILGWDHVAAMVAVGLWGAVLGAPAIWTLPVVFPLVMALGGALAIVGMPLPFIEIGIAASAIVIGLMVALAMKTHLALAIVITGLFAIFHGYAHGAEMPGTASPLAYAIGFVIATGLLHLVGITIGLLAKVPHGMVAVRACGLVIAVAGAAFLASAIA